MLVSHHPLASLGRLAWRRRARGAQSPFRRACLISLGLHVAVLALVAYVDGFKAWPDGGVPQRLEVRLVSRATTATTNTQQTQLESTNAEGPRADGHASVGSIVLTPPEPLGDMPLLIDGMPGAAQLQLDIDANGKVTAIRVQSSTLEPNTEREMIERMRSIRFRPGSENGKPALSRLVLEVRVESSAQ